MIEKLLNERIIGYACVVTTTIRRKDKSSFEKSLKETKAYELANQMMHPNNILIDVITGSYRKRKELLEIVDTFENNTISRKNPIGCIVMPSVFDLGTNAKEFKRNYLMLCQKDIGILFLDNSDLSTVDYNWQYCKTLSDTTPFLDALKDADIPSRQGRKKKPLVVTDTFKELYWLYENYFISEKIVYKNKLIGKITKVAFNQLCDLYESLPEYASDEYEQEQLHKILQKPKRHGAVPAFFPDIISMRENGVSLKDACERLKFAPISEITFERLKIKAEHGRSATGKATFQYHDASLEESILPDENGHSY